MTDTQLDQVTVERVIWKRRALVLLKFVGAQTLVQVMSLCIGFLLVHKLKVTEYAFFTLATTMQGTIAILSDSGVGSALSSIGGRIWSDDHRFGQLIKAGLQFRRALILFYASLLIPFTGWMLLKNGNDWASTLFICGAVLIGVQFQLTSGVLQVVPRMRSRLDQLQQIDLWMVSVRFLFLGIAYLILLNVEISIAISTLGFGLQYWLLKRWVSQSVNLETSVVEEDWKSIKRSVFHLTPTTVFYCIQSQLTVLLLSLFGNTQNVADVGALGRLSVVLAVFSSVMANIFYPRFARCQDLKRLKWMYWQILGVNLAFGSFFIIAAWLFPAPILWVLGKQYSHLQVELVYMMFNSLIVIMGGAISTMNNERAWTQGTWVSIPLIIGSQIAMLPFLNLSSTRDVLLLGSLPYITGWIPFFYRANQGFHSTSSART